MKETITLFNGDIGYTEVDLTSGLEWAKKELDGFRFDLENPDELTRNLATQAIPQYESAIQHGDQLKPAEMMAELKAIFDRAHNLEAALLKPEEIGRRMGQQFGDQISCYRVILRQSPGWIKSLGQLVFAAAAGNNS